MLRALVPALLALAVVGCSASTPENQGGSAGAGAGHGSTGGSGSGQGGGGGSPAGGGAIGDACTTDADCTDPPAECWTTIGGGGFPSVTFPGGFCSKACTTEGTGNECGDVAGCSSIGVSGGQATVTLTMCTPPCASDADCRAAEGYKCFQLLPGMGVCTL